MLYKLFTDASYSPINFIGFISIDIYNEDNTLLHSVDIKCENEKNSRMEKIGIDYCLNYITSNNIHNYTIYSDCLSFINKCNNNNIIFVKGHSKMIDKTDDEKLFKKVDLRSRKLLRKLLKETLNK